MKKTCLFTLFLIALLSCKKDNEAEDLYHSPELIECYSNTLFDCMDGSGPEYFSCRLDGKDFCRTAGTADYISYYRPTLVVITNGPTLELSNTLGRYCLEFGIRHQDATKDQESKLLFNYIAPGQATPREMLDHAFRACLDFS